MAFTTVVGGFEIASTIATCVGVGQTHLNSKNNQFCQVNDSLSRTHSNLLLAFEGLCTFANILTEDECNIYKNTCAIIKNKLLRYEKTPIPRKKKLFRKTQEYKDHLSVVRELETKASDLLVDVKQVSSNAVITLAQRKRAEEQDRIAREARRNFLEDIRYWTTMEQLNLADFPDLPNMTKSMKQETQSPNATQELLQQDPFSDRVFTAWAEDKPLQDCM